MVCSPYSRPLAALTGALTAPTAAIAARPRAQGPPVKVPRNARAVELDPESWVVNGARELHSRELVGLREGGSSGPLGRPVGSR